MAAPSCNAFPAATPRGVPHVDEAPRRAPHFGSDTLRRLENFRYEHEVQGGLLVVRLIEAGDVSATVRLLAQTFADATCKPPRQVRFLAFWLEQYLEQKARQHPHVAILVGLYRRSDATAETQLAGTAEVSLDEMGASDAPPTPAPPRDAPYICNMTVDKAFRRRHIGRYLLKACETLVLEMCGSTTVYLHCRVKDKGPLKMYEEAGYTVVKTDNLLVCLRFKKYKHLMCKKLELG